MLAYRGTERVALCLQFTTRSRKQPIDLAGARTEALECKDALGVHQARSESPAREKDRYPYDIASSFSAGFGLAPYVGMVLGKAHCMRKLRRLRLGTSYNTQLLPSRGKLCRCLTHQLKMTSYESDIYEILDGSILGRIAPGNRGRDEPGYGQDRERNTGAPQVSISNADCSRWKGSTVFLSVVELDSRRFEAWVGG